MMNLEGMMQDVSSKVNKKMENQYRYNYTCGEKIFPTWQNNGQ